MKKSAQGWMRKEEYRAPRAARPLFRRPTDKAEYHLSHLNRALLESCQANGKRAATKKRKSPATERAYATDWAAFCAFCEGRGVKPRPASPEIVAEFLIYDLEYNRVTANRVGRRVAAIHHYHNLSALPSPTDDERVRDAVRGIRRALATEPDKKTPVTAEQVVAMVRNTGGGLIGLRDRALLLLGFSCRFRRSQLVELDCEDIANVEQGLMKPIEPNPIEAVQAWCDAAGITTGPLFRSIRKGGKVGARLSAQSVADIVKTHAENVGLDPALFSAESLRGAT